MKPFLSVLLINSLFLIFRVLYVVLYPTDLSPEEAQYWDWSRHLDLSYYSKPPMVAYMNLLTRHILGNTEIAVRITPIVLSFILSLVTYAFLKKHTNTGTALVGSTFPHLTVGFSVNSVLMTTDAPLVFFWALTLMTMYEAHLRRSAPLWLLTGTWAGLCFLSKYTAVFLLPLGILFLLLKDREQLRTWKPYLSLIPAFIISLPVLLWNVKNDWVSVKHVLSLGTSGSSPPNLSTFGEFFGGQVLLMSVVPFFLMVLGWMKPKTRLEVFLTVFSFPILLLFGLMALKKEVYANWTAPALFGGMVLAVIRMSRRPALLRASLVVALPLFLLLHFTPLLDRIGLGKLLPPGRDPTKVMVGWSDLGKEVSLLHRPGNLILSDRYQIAAELAFYVDGNPRTFVFHTGRRTQYYLWRHMIKEYAGRDGIFVTEDGLPESLKMSFVHAEFLKSMEIRWRGERIRVFKIYRLRRFSGVLHESPKGY